MACYRPTRIDQISEIINGFGANGNTLVLIDRIKTGEMLAERNRFVLVKMKQQTGKIIMMTF